MLEDRLEAYYEIGFGRFCNLRARLTGHDLDVNSLLDGLGGHLLVHGTDRVRFWARPRVAIRPVHWRRPQRNELAIVCRA
jgi:hypothetical protein